MKNLQKGFKNFISYWFALTIIPGIVNPTNQILDFAIVSIGFAIVIEFIVPVLTFFKIDHKKETTYALAGIVFSTGYTFLIKPGILGLIYFPQKITAQDFSQYFDSVSFEVGEFGIILLVGIISILISIFLRKKF